jgi:hypothetical protein
LAGAARNSAQYVGCLLIGQPNQLWFSGDSVPRKALCLKGGFSILFRPKTKRIPGRFATDIYGEFQRENFG